MHFLLRDGLWYNIPIMERLRATPQSYAKKAEWIETAMAEGAHNQPPKGAHFTQERWDRAVDIGLLVNMGPETTGQSVADLFHVGKQEIWRINKNFLTYLHRNCSQEIRSRFPLEAMPLDKPLPQILKDKRSLTRRGLLVRIKEELNNGVRNVRKIAENLGVSVSAVSSERQILKEQSINLPYVFNNYRKNDYEIKKAIEKGDIVKLRRKLKSVPPAYVHSRLQKYDNRQPIFITVGKLVRDLGLGKGNRKQLIKVIEFADIPIRRIALNMVKHREKNYRQAYWIIYAAHTSWIRRLVEKTDLLSVSEQAEIHR
ncbi:MAG: hypothetical protein US55_C0055G0002 [Candidatus Levybacteria bacterium GW2011_GWC2_37_7]|nr:MAG: hypothetical protein US55_C0055G0002 [Candidatus Levybacteria bacterium GW2011_GWC2_37_7]